MVPLRDPFLHRTFGLLMQAGWLNGFFDWGWPGPGCDGRAGGWMQGFDPGRQTTD